MVDGQHILDFALENLDIDALRVLFERGGLEKSATGLNLVDKAFVHAFARVYRALYCFRNEVGIPEADAEELDSLLRVTVRCSFGNGNSRRIRFRIVRSASELDNAMLPVKARIEALKQGLEMYLRGVRTKKEGKPKEEELGTESIVSLMDQAIGIPDLSELTLALLY